MSNVMKSDEKKLINQLFWRSFALEGSFQLGRFFNWERS